MPPPAAAPLSIFQPNLNFTVFNEAHHLNVIPSTYPAPSLPDNYYCNPFYAEPETATMSDCQIALGLLLAGNAGQPFPIISTTMTPTDSQFLCLTVSNLRKAESSAFLMARIRYKARVRLCSQLLENRRAKRAQS